MKITFIMLVLLFMSASSHSQGTQVTQRTHSETDFASSLNLVSPAAGNETRNLENSNRANIPKKQRPIVSTGQRPNRSRNNTSNSQGRFTTCTIKADTTQQYINNMLPYGSQQACANAPRGNHVTSVSGVE